MSTAIQEREATSLSIPASVLAWTQTVLPPEELPPSFGSSCAHDDERNESDVTQLATVSLPVVSAVLRQPVRASRVTARLPVASHMRVTVRPTAALIAEEVRRFSLESGRSPEVVYLSPLRLLTVPGPWSRYPVTIDVLEIFVRLDSLNGLGDDEARAVVKGF